MLTLFTVVPANRSGVSSILPDILDRLLWQTAQCSVNIANSAVHQAITMIIGSISRLDFLICSELFSEKADEEQVSLEVENNLKK